MEPPFRWANKKVREEGLMTARKKWGKIEALETEPKGRSGRGWNCCSTNGCASRYSGGKMVLGFGGGE